jgi:maltooligosyltrehalose trehalohydrolase
VHALVDTTAVNILEELSTETAVLAEELGRPLSLVAESDRNDPRLITPRDRGGLGMTAQWDDDIHHAIHAAVRVNGRATTAISDRSRRWRRR